jgi:D-glycero-alpha-D-manno-heptose-7-phosphate kinase
MLDHARVIETASVRAPLRIALGGGGTDLPSHYREHGGFVVSAAIDRRIHVTVGPAQGTRYRLVHLEWEEVEDPAEIRHPILRATIARYWNGQPLDLSSTGDVPPGTGLGSSGAYTVCAVKALEEASGRLISPADLAEAACAIELGDLGRTVGKQDQYAAAYGGVNAYTFGQDGSVEVRRLALSPETRAAFRDHFLLFFTGQSRSASEILANQVERTLAGDADLLENLKRSEELARAGAAALEEGDLATMGRLMTEQWELKSRRLPHIATPRFERLRAAAVEAGAGGVTMMGAGGGGFLLAYAPDPERVRGAMEEVGAPELTFDIDEQGATAH